MAKFDVQGRDAGRVLERISANQVDGEPGQITYTQWLNPGGTLEADLDVALVDYLGGLAEGRLARGDNPVLMTMELVLEVLDEGAL